MTYALSSQSHDHPSRGGQKWHIRREYGPSMCGIPERLYERPLLDGGDPLTAGQLREQIALDADGYVCRVCVSRFLRSSVSPKQGSAP